MKRAGSEHELYEQIARYMAFAHQGVLYRFDLAADLKLTVGQAARHKRLHPFRGWPDLFIAHYGHKPGKDSWDADGYFYGLFIELKREGTRLKKRDGSWASAHIAEQASVLEQLRQQGYEATFACGIDEAIKTISSYLEGDSPS